MYDLPIKRISKSFFKKWQEIIIQPLLKEPRNVLTCIDQCWLAHDLCLACSKVLGSLELPRSSLWDWVVWDRDGLKTVKDSLVLLAHVSQYTQLFINRTWCSECRCGTVEGKWDMDSQCTRCLPPTSLGAVVGVFMIIFTWQMLRMLTAHAFWSTLSWVLDYAKSVARSGREHMQCEGVNRRCTLWGVGTR